MNTFLSTQINSTNYFGRDVSIWDRNVQAKITQELDDNISDPGSLAIYAIFEDIVSLHYRRRVVTHGMWQRTKMTKATRFDWEDPREADGVPIFSRESPGATKENHKLHTAFDKKIITNKAAYVAGMAPAIEGGDQLIEFYTDADFEGKLVELLQSATRGGTSYILAVSPEKQNDVFLTMIDEWECASFYDPITGALKYSVRYFEELSLDNATSVDYTFELYTQDKKYSYRYDGAWHFEGDAVHLFDGVPLVEFANNTERIGDVEITTSLQDAFDILNSDLSSEVTQMRLAYLLLKTNAVDVDDELLNTLKQTGIFPVEEGDDVSFIEKNINSAAVENLKMDLERQIYEYSNSYDPSSLGSSGDITAYQIKQKLFGLEQSASETIKMFKGSALYLFGLVGEYMKKFKSMSDVEDFTISFRRNIPSNNLEDLKLAVESGFKVSQTKMAELMPFEVNQEENQEQLAEESAAFGVDDPFGDSMAIGGDVAEAVEVAKLSGIQITAANDIISAVARGELTREAAMNQLQVFLGLTPEQANQVMGKVQARAITFPETEA